MERDGYEADLNRLCVMDRATGEKRFVSQGFQSNVDAFLWNKDSRSIFFLGVWQAEPKSTTPVWKMTNIYTNCPTACTTYASMAIMR